MGFETVADKMVSSKVDEIWTLSLWDLKLLFTDFCIGHPYWFELCPYGIWNNRTANDEGRRFNTFELCPYGIWNKSTKYKGEILSHLNFVPMGFETN